MTTTETPTTTPMPGCCKGETMSSNEKCNAIEDMDKCERSSSCHFIKDGVLEKDCDFGTTERPEEPGCCYINPDVAYSKRYQTMCISFSTERECLQQTDSNGASRCVFEPMNEYMDCEALWPTTTTTTEEVGCCYSGDSYKANDRCGKATDRSRCEDMGCEFLVTDDPDDCIMTTTETPTTTEDVGCCMGDSHKTNDMCNNRLTRSQCERSSSCIFVEDGVLEEGDCDIGTTQPPEEPGCCYINPEQAYSKRYQDTCITFQTERECLMLKDSNGVPRCTFEEMNEYMDCSMVWPTTTTTTIEPGCCKGSSYKNQDKCLGFDNRADCERRGCDFVSGGSYEDCVITTTESPTTTVIPGCCAHTSMRPNDKCNDIEDLDQCNRRASCFFIEFGLLDLSCILEPDTTPTPEEPGCCYGNPDIAYSKRWMESCKAFGFESECLMLKNDDGEPRCTFEPMGEYEDCETAWPTTTTTTEEVGCCYSGDSYKANDKCSRATDRDRCESMGCSFLVTEDPKDCEMTTTETPTTTEEEGCCYGEGAKENEMCGNKVGRDQCERSGKCEFHSGPDADCDYIPVTSTLPAGCCKGLDRKTADNCAEKMDRDSCERSGKCEFIETDDPMDCVYPTTTSEPWLGEQDEYALPFNPYKQSKKSSRKGRRQEEAMLFGADSAVAQAMQTQVSLSSVLLMVAAAFALYQAYRWMAARKADYKPLPSQSAGQYYQTA